MFITFGVICNDMYFPGLLYATLLQDYVTQELRKNLQLPLVNSLCTSALYYIFVIVHQIIIDFVTDKWIVELYCPTPISPIFSGKPMVRHFISELKAKTFFFPESSQIIPQNKVHVQVHCSSPDRELNQTLSMA